MKAETDQERLTRLKAIVSRLPESPGCYQYLDASGAVIYVGKAKNLKRRVSSYFHTEVDRYKTKVLVSKIQDIKYAVVKTDQEAFLLENSLIKKYNPRYNVLLKDGKTYPYICVTKEEYPRIFKTRRVNKKYGQYYGPFSHLGSMYAMLDIIHKLYKPRTCNLPLLCDNVAQGKYKSCLEWHIKNCKAPCIGKQTHEEYLNNIAEAKEILKGNTRQISRGIYNKMMDLSAQLRFEEAEEMKRKYLLIEDYCSKSEVVSNTINDVDVFSITNDEKIAYVNFLHVTNGSINQAFTFEYKKKLEETDLELLQLGIIEIRNRYNSSTREIIVPFEMDMELEGVTFTVPQRGDKKTLLELSLMNCKQYKFDRLKQSEKLNPEQKSVRLMKEIQEHLRLDKMPYWIECFDNSNISGSDPVAGLVVFKKLKPSKSDYRRYNIKSVLGADDYASMHEVVLRRYERLKEEGNGFPDLIITDGGKGQMGVVRDALMELRLDIPVAGLAKNDRHRTSELLMFSDEGIVSVGMKVESELFKLLTRIQDEVHRYAITFHRDKRSKHQVHSELDDIKGIGEKTKSTLLTTFRSVKKIREASVEDLIAAVGKAKAQIIIDYYKS
ncbi:MAG: excinuclease ABC subunit UvrC [Prevotellaceae bacterium]|nr:excinuclease ABC subunit UvrC [Prevotellaceae bacterium]